MQISITVTPEEHHQLRAICDALAAMAATRGELQAVSKTLAPEDRPDVGVDTQQQAAAVIFGGQPAAPLAPPAAPAIPAVPQPTTSAASLPTPASAEPADSPNPQPPLVDSRGLPWDERIHAGTKALNADGTWRQRRGVNDANLVKRIEEELRGVMAVPAPPVPPAAPPAVVLTAAGAAAGLPFMAQSVPATFPDLMKKATALMASGKLVREELESCAQAAGLPAIVAATQRPDLIPAIAEQIDALVAAKG